MSTSVKNVSKNIVSVIIMLKCKQPVRMYTQVTSPHMIHICESYDLFHMRSIVGAHGFSIRCTALKAVWRMEGPWVPTMYEIIKKGIISESYVTNHI